MKEGRIEHVGSYQQLMESGLDFSSIVISQTEKITQVQAASQTNETCIADLSGIVPQFKISEVKDKPGVKPGKLISEEERTKGKGNI